MLRTLTDYWVKHFYYKGDSLIISHNLGELSLLRASISSHKELSLGQVVIRLFSGQRYEISLQCFRVDEIKPFFEVLRNIELKNREKKIKTLQ